MWILWAVLGALCKSLTSFIRKKIASTNTDIYVFVSFVLISVIIAGLAYMLPDESLSSIKYAPAAIIASGLVQIVAIRANLYAFKHEQLSYITPMFALTPLYTAIWAFITIGERPSGVGMLGIMAIVLGVYVVTSKPGVGITETARHILNNKGARVGMLVPIAYAVSATFNKAAINEGVTPIASLVLITAIMGVAHIYVLRSKSSRQEVVATLHNSKIMKLILLATILGVGSVVFAALALNEAFTSYALSIRRLDVLITVFLGWKFMDDTDFKRRFIGAAIMTVGVVLIAFS